MRKRWFVSLLLAGMFVMAPVVRAASWEFECGRAALNPACGWCATSCIYAIIADLWHGDSPVWDWNI